MVFSLFHFILRRIINGTDVRILDTWDRILHERQGAYRKDSHIINLSV